MRRCLHRAALALLLLWPILALADEPAAPANDDELRARIVKAGDSSANGGADRVVVLHRTRVDVEESGLAHIVDRQVIKCLAEPGAAQLARLRFDYDPTSNVVEIRRIRVIRKGGAIENVPPERIVDLPQPQQLIYWGARMKLVPVPRLAIGDAVEVESYTKGFLIAYLGDGEGDEKYIPPMRGHFYDVVTFHDAVPVRERHYTLTTPKDKPVQFEVYNGEVSSFAGFDADRLVYRFWRQNVPAFHAEPRAVSDADTQPKVVLATVASWKDKSRWFAEVNDRQFEANDAIKAKVAELTRGLAKDEDKVAAIVHWSADNIRYSGVTMGKGEGYVLHPGAMIFEDRSGVCKDKAGMAITMLRAAGYEAYPAMTMAGARVERVPADQFNHCVAAWKKSDGSFRLLDPTWVPLSMELWSSAEGEQHYLIGTKEGIELEQTPAFDPAENKIRLDSQATIDAAGTLSGTITITGKGVAEQRLRRELVGVGARDRQAWFERIVQLLAPGATVEPVALTTAALEDVKTPVKAVVRYRAPRYALASGKTLMFVPPAARHPLRGANFSPYFDAADLETRTQGIQLGAPRMMEVVETIAFPAGWRVTRLPKERQLDGAAASLAVKESVRGAAIDVDYRLVVKRRIVPASDYANFRDVVREAKALDTDLVVLEKEGR